MRPTELDEQCQNAQELLSNWQGTPATVDMPHDLNGPITGATRPGCQIKLEGRGGTFPDFLTVAQQLNALLSAQGWVEDQQCLADSPTSTASTVPANVVAETRIPFEAAV